MSYNRIDGDGGLLISRYHQEQFFSSQAQNYFQKMPLIASSSKIKYFVESGVTLEKKKTLLKPRGQKQGNQDLSQAICKYFTTDAPYFLQNSQINKISEQQIKATGKIQLNQPETQTVHKETRYIF